MRLLVPELLKRRRLTAYQLAVRSRGRISLTHAYRWARTGAFRALSPEMLAALCDVFEVTPGQLFTTKAPPPYPTKRPGRPRSRG